MNTKPLFSSKSLRFRLAVSSIVLGVAFTLLLGLIAYRAGQDAGLPSEVVRQVQEQILWWGLGAVVLAGLLGALLGRQIVEPVARLDRQLREGSLLQFTRDSLDYRDWQELDHLATTMEELVAKLRKRDAELASSEAKFRATFDLVEIGLTHVDPAGRFLVVNRKMCEMLGYSRDELVGMYFKDISHPDERVLDDTVLIDSRTVGDDIRTREKRYLRKDGSTLWARRSTATVRERQEGPILAVSAIEDVSEYYATQETLRTLNESLRAIVENSPLAIYSVTPDGIVTLWNPAAERLFELKQAEVLGRPSPLTLPEKTGLVAEIRQRVLAGETLYNVDLTHIKPDGSTIVLSLSAAPLRGNDQQITGVLVTCTDITGLKNIEFALEASEARFRALSESAMDIVTVIDPAGEILYQSPSVRHLLGFEPEQMIGMNQFDLIHRDDVTMVRESFDEIIQKGQLGRAVEFRVRDASGAWRTLESIGKNCLEIPAIRGIIVNTRDVSERRAIQQRVQHLAFHDALTGLPNRSLLQDRIALAISRAERSEKKLAVMFIDIDNFKNINDSLGHDVGDELLREVGRRLTVSVRGHDTIARQGGDEFIVLLEELESQIGAARVAQKILEALRLTFSVGGTNQHISGSVGIAMFPEDGSDSQTLMKNADTAMFHGKALGKNTYQFFTQQMNIAVKRRALLESSLRGAVKDSDFVLHYQPQVDLKTGQVVAVEALVRWRGQDGGIVMPADFIPLAEETGLISEIGEWVMREGCRQARQWQLDGLPERRMAINLSTRQLSDKGFLNMVQRVLDETGLDAKWLELEITESQVMRQAEGSIMLLNELADLGIHLAVDDFGTGYSSLSYLKRLPIAKLKIDQSFVRDITVDPNDTAIVVAIIQMAKSLDLEIIAEGIETEGQLKLLRSKGCGIGQGYYFSVPMSAEAMLPLLKQRSLFAEPAAV